MPDAGDVGRAKADGVEVVVVVAIAVRGREYEVNLRQRQAGRQAGERRGAAVWSGQQTSSGSRSRTALQVGLRRQPHVPRVGTEDSTSRSEWVPLTHTLTHSHTFKS